MNRRLFDIEKVKAVYAAIPDLVQQSRRAQLTTPELRDVVEKKCGEISQGDIILAMLLHGYKARFGLPNKPLKIRCEFNAVLI